MMEHPLYKEMPRFNDADISEESSLIISIAHQPEPPKEPVSQRETLHFSDGSKLTFSSGTCVFRRWQTRLLPCRFEWVRPRKICHRNPFSSLPCTLLWSSLGTVILSTSGKWIHENQINRKYPKSVAKLNDWRPDIVCSHLKGPVEGKDRRIMKDPVLGRKGFAIRAIGTSVDHLLLFLGGIILGRDTTTAHRSRTIVFAIGHIIYEHQLHVEYERSEWIQTFCISPLFQNQEVFPPRVKCLFHFRPELLLTMYFYIWGTHLYRTPFIFHPFIKLPWSRNSVLAPSGCITMNILLTAAPSLS